MFLLSLASVVLRQLVSLASLILLFVWMYQHLGGLGWYGKKNFFNAHPFFMVLGIAFFLTNGPHHSSHLTSSPLAALAQAQ